MKVDVIMSMTYKLNILDALKSIDITTYKIRKEKLLSESTVQKLRRFEPVSWENIESLCELLNCQPGDILKYEPIDNQGK